MATLPQGMRDEHSEQVTRLELLRAVADLINSVPIASLRDNVGQAYSFLIHQFLPHAQAEEKVLYPTVGKLLHAVEAPDTMSRDHLEVMRLTEELETLRLHLFYAPLSTSDEHALRRVLYGLYAIIKLHLAKEEEIYLPILEARLPPAEMDHLVEAMEKTVTEVKSHLRMMEMTDRRE